ncbi:MAG TPA: MFS transporter [Solirubrobacteraceae bacterium]|nr:MFS transporter [Solirubrobacteraceae bacterium]
MLKPLKRLALDISPVRESRDYRLLFIGQIVSNIGTQAALVALPYQIFVLTHSAVLVGLLGAFELGPMIVVSLLGGALADRLDRRMLLAIAQLAVITAAGALAAAALVGKPPVLLVLVLGGLLAGGAALDGVTRTAIIPNVLGPERLRTGLALNFGIYQVTGIIGPAIGGLLISATSVGVTYIVDAASCLAMLVAALAIAPQPPVQADHPPVLSSIAEGLRFVRSNRALAGSFAIDLVAMTFGMPRALFAVLSLTVYHAGAAGAGALYSAVAAGATLAVLTSGWIRHARRLGQIVIGAVLVWGAAIALVGLVDTIAPAIALLALAGFADSVSAVCRSTINQTVTPDELRGRMSAVFSLVVTSGPRLGDIESGTVAGLTSPRISVTSGGLACLVGVGLIMLAFPQLAAYGTGTGPPLAAVSG